MNLTKAISQVKQIIRSSKLDGENVVFTKSPAGWCMFNEFDRQEIGECEALDFLAEVFQAYYIIANLEDFLDLRFDVSVEEKAILKQLNTFRGSIERIFNGYLPIEKGNMEKVNWAEA